MTDSILRRGRGVRHSAPAEFSERRDTDVLAQSTTDRKRVAARIGRSRSTVDKVLESEERSPVTTLRLWLAANLETASPDVALAPLRYLNDAFADALSTAKSRGEREDLLRESAEAMVSFGALCRELSAALRDGRITDSERGSLERLIRKHEDEVAELRREIAASNELWRSGVDDDTALTARSWLKRQRP